MNMTEIMTEVLSQDAQMLTDSAEFRRGKNVARFIGEELARASMNGDIKAAAMLMELAGMDFRSRDALEKRELDRQKLNMNLPQANIVFEDVRPAQKEQAET